MKTSKRILIALAAIACAATPTLAQRIPYTSGHARTVSYHDRTPHAHDHSSSAHH